MAPLGTRPGPVEDISSTIAEARRRAKRKLMSDEEIRELVSWADETRWRRNPGPAPSLRPHLRAFPERPASHGRDPGFPQHFMSEILPFYNIS